MMKLATRGRLKTSVSEPRLIPRIRPLSTQDVTHAHIRKPQQDRNGEEFGPHRVRKVVLTEREAGNDTHILDDVAHNQAKAGKNENAAKPISDHAMKQREYGCGKNVERRDDQ